MKSREYIPNVKCSICNSALIGVLRLLFKQTLSGLSNAELITIGRGTILANLLFQRILGINRNVPFMVHFTSRVTCADAIEFKDSKSSVLTFSSFATSAGCYISGINGIVFGPNVLFAPGTKIISANHDERNVRLHKSASPIIIEDDVWIGASAVILPGVKIGARSVIGAGAVVGSNVPSGEVWGGVPARKIRNTEV